MKRTCWTIVVGLALVTAVPADGAVPPAESAQRLQVPTPRGQDDARVEVEAVRRRVEILARSGRVGQAIELLERREDERGELENSLARRLARLYRDAGRWEDLEALLLRAVDGDETGLDIGQTRLLAEARYERDRPEEARATLDRLIERDPNDTSLRRMVANVLGQRGRVAEAIDILVEGRRISGDPLDFAQLLGRFHARLGQMPDAVREYCKVIVASPLNVSLMRGQVLEMASDAPQQIEAMLEVAREMAARHRDVPQIGIVVAELEMRAGDADAAWKTLSRLVGERELTQEMLRLALAGLADSRLPDADPDQILPRLRLSARVARAMLANETVPASLEPRVYDTLVRSLLAMLENDAFGRLDRDEQFDILDETRRSIVEMQERFAGNRLTASALLRLAGVYVDALHEPEPAIELYELLAVNTSSSREEVNLARLGLARAHVAQGDTATAREMFTSIGQDMDFVEGQGRAQYHLGLIDFMGGELTTAQDRLKAVAAEAPRAEYTNDALDLALVLVEHEMSGDTDDTSLLQYGAALYQKATHQPDALVNTLVEIAEGSPGGVRERARLDLARLAHDRRDHDEAVVWATRVADEAAVSRYAAPALDLKGEVLEQAGRPDEALAVYERLLLEHEGYVLMDRIRDRVRALRGEDGGPDEEELP